MESVYQELKQEAFSLGVQDIVENDVDYSRYRAVAKIIFISECDYKNDKNCICAIAHELGHHVSLSKSCEEIDKILVANKVKFYEPRKLTPYQKFLLYKEEASAWKTGREFLVKLGFKDLKYYDSISKFYTKLTSFRQYKRFLKRGRKDLRNLRIQQKSKSIEQSDNKKEPCVL